MARLTSHGCRGGYWMCRAAERGALCNHFYFPLLAALPSDLDCISRGRQRQNKGMLGMCACAIAPGWDWQEDKGKGSEDGRRRFNKRDSRYQARLIALLINAASFTKSYKLTEQCWGYWQRTPPDPARTASSQDTPSNFRESSSNQPIQFSGCSE